MVSVTETHAKKHLLREFLEPVPRVPHCRPGMLWF